MMETKSASLDDSWTKYYLNRIEHHQRSGGLSSYIASVKEAGMVPGAGLGDAAWHGWQAVRQANSWHLVRSFTLLATSVAALPFIIIAPNAIVATGDKLRLREQWDQQPKALSDQIKSFAAKPQLLTSVVLVTVAAALYQFRSSATPPPCTPLPPMKSPSLQDSSILCMIGTAIFGGFLALPFVKRIKQTPPPTEPRVLEAPIIKDPTPTDPQAVWKKWVVFNQDGSVHGSSGKCHVAEVIGDKVRISGWSDVWCLGEDNNISFTCNQHLSRPVVRFSFETDCAPFPQYQVRVDGHSYPANMHDKKLTFTIGKEKKTIDTSPFSKVKPYELSNDRRSIEVGDTAYSCELRRYDNSIDPDYVAILVDDSWIELPFTWKSENVETTFSLKLQKANCAPFVNVRWKGSMTQRPVCLNSEGRPYVLIGGDYYYVKDHRDRKAILVNNEHFFLEYMYVPPENNILHEESK